MKKRVRGVLFVAVATLPTAANAQVPVYPSGAIPQPPVELDPSVTGSQAPPPTPPPQPQAPNVVVVKPDGTVTNSSDTNAAPTGYFIDSNAPTGIMNPESEPAQVNAGPVPELHVVRSGDTLWDICSYYFNDPWEWPKIWSYNPQITNPHWIYPGDLVRLLPRGQFASSNDADVTKPTTAPEETKPVDNLPPPARKLGVGLQQIAFVEKSDLDKSITIDGSVDEKVLLGRGDAVYLSYPTNNPPEVGKTYSIYVPDNTVAHDGKSYGAYVRLLGTLRVDNVTQDKRARAVITDSNMEIQRGAKVGPLLKQFSTVPNVPPKVDLQANIVAMLTRENLIGQGELVFVDAGQGSGLEVGNRMYVVRRGDAYPGHAPTTVGQNDRRFPVRSLGQIVIVEVGDKISVGLVTLSIQEMGVGDVVMMQAAK